jgi:hypothetical protein
MIITERPGIRIGDNVSDRVKSNYKIFIVTIFVPSEFPGSNTRTGCRCEHRRLAR